MTNEEKFYKLCQIILKNASHITYGKKDGKWEVDCFGLSIGIWSITMEWLPPDGYYIHLYDRDDFSKVFYPDDEWNRIEAMLEKTDFSYWLDEIEEAVNEN